MLVEFGMKGVRTERLAVNVKNARWAYRGLAYDVVPYESPAYRQASVHRLVTIGIGPETDFPVNNLITKRRWQSVSEEEYQSLSETGRQQLRHSTYGGGRRHTYARETSVVHPYGGKRSPRIDMADWREALVAVAAHEGRHIWQYQHNKPRSEVDAERFAAKALERWRNGGGK